MFTGHIRRITLIYFRFIDSGLAKISLDMTFLSYERKHRAGYVALSR